MSIAQTADFKLAAAPLAARRWEMAAASLCLVQFSEPLFAAIAQAQGATEPPGYARIFFAPVYAFLAWVLWRDRTEATRTAVAAPLMMALLVLAFASTLWSIDSGATFRRSIWLALNMAFGFYLAWRYTWRELLEVLGGGYIVLIIGSFATAMLAPNVGVMSFEHPGAWCGLWTHKNMMGGIMALGAAVCVSAAIVAPERRRLWVVAALGAAMLVLLSTSKTSLLAMLLGLALIAAGVVLRRGPVFATLVGAGVTAAVVLIASIFLVAPELIVQVLGRDLTFTGRTDIWNAAGPAVAARPWLGYGYYAFWLNENGPAYWVRQAVGWNVPSAHSGWLETALGLGRVGVALMALQLSATLWRGVRSVFDPAAGLWAPALLAAFTLYTMSESHALQANNLFWTIYVAAAARLALDAVEKKQP